MTDFCASRIARVSRCAFTLTELLVSITIIVILAATLLFGMAGVQNTAKVQRTKSQIARIHEMLAERWESYETRRVQFSSDPRLRYPDGTPYPPQLNRLIVHRELMRLELPERQTDSDDTSISPTFTKLGIPLPSLARYYANFIANHASPSWSPENQSSECLYMILSRMEVGDGNGLEFFSENEIGDTDGDGMPEILDGWRNPIRFIRWPAGYTGPSGIQTGDPSGGGDAFDLARADWRLKNMDSTDDTYAIFPLVYSSGPDGEYGLAINGRGEGNTVIPVVYDNGSVPFPNDPYKTMPSSSGCRFVSAAHSAMALTKTTSPIMRSPRLRITSRRRSGLTLVELLVVVVILVMLVGVVLPLARPVLRGREVREAARQVNTFFAAAQARAMALGRPVAVVLERDPNNPNRCFQIATAKSPPPYAGDTMDARAAINLSTTPWQATLSSAAAFASPDFVRPGDLIKFDYRGQLYQIVNFTVNSANSTAVIQFTGSVPPVASPAGVPYQIFRTPRKSAAAPVELPVRTYINLEFSGFGPPGVLPGPDDDYRGTDFAGSL